MARRRYYRSKVTRPKWSINTIDMNADVAAQQANRALEFNNVIITNPAGGSLTGASPIIKTARFRVKGVISPYQDDDENPAFPSDSSFIIAVMYIPEGTTIASNPTSAGDITGYNFYRHPEWVMGWVRMDYTALAQRNEFSISSRLKRNLNRGDSIQLITIFANKNASLAAPSFKIHASASYVCRTN